MNTSIIGIGEIVITLPAEKTLALGDFVTINDTGTAVKAANEAEPVGVCVSRNGAYAGVQVKGGVRVPCTDSTLKPGYQILKVSDGKLAKGTAGTPHLVVSADTVLETAEVIL